MSAEMDWIHGLLSGYIICFFIALAVFLCSICIGVCFGVFDHEKKPADDGEKKEEPKEETPADGEPGQDDEYKRAD